MDFRTLRRDLKLLWWRATLEASWSSKYTSYFSKGSLCINFCEQQKTHGIDQRKRQHPNAISDSSAFPIPPHRPPPGGPNGPPPCGGLILCPIPCIPGPGLIWGGIWKFGGGINPCGGIPPGGGKGMFMGGPLGPGPPAGGKGGKGMPRPPGAVGRISGLLEQRSLEREIKG